MNNLLSNKIFNPSERLALLFLIKRYKKIMGGVLVLSVVAGALENITLGALHVFLQYFFNEGGKLEFGKYFNALINLFPGNDPITSIGILIGVALVMKSFFVLVNEAMIGKVSGNTMYDMKKMVMDKYSQAPYQYFLDTKFGKLSYSVLTASSRTAQLMLHLPKAGAELIKVSMIIVFLIYYNWRVTVACMVVLLLFMYFIRQLARKVSYHTGKGRIESHKGFYNAFNEFVTGIKYLNIFGKKKHWLEMFNSQSEEFSRLYQKDIFWIATPRQFLEIVFFGGTIVGLLVIRSSFKGAVLNVIPMLGVYFLGMMKILPSANNIGNLYMQITNSISDADLLYRVFHKEVEPVNDGEKTLEKFDLGIEFKGVEFCHAGRDIILDKIDLSIEKGKVTAVVGESGSGKSTILNLILRLFEPTEGEITIDGHPLNSIRLKSWLDQVGFVGQDTFIFHSSIYENITFGDNKFSQDDVEKAAQIAGIHDFITNLPEGYQTMVGERGMKLSGGQQQRIAIARAIIRNPEVLILDEATSSLDSITEENVQKAIDKTLQERTVIMVAHRLSTIEHADKIVVLKAGQIVEEGTHSQLFAQAGEYRQLYTMQNKSRID